jgi:DNA replication protein DnaC
MTALPVMDDLLRRLRLGQLAGQLPALLEAARVQQLSYEAFLATILEAELAGRDERAQARRLRAARLPMHGRLENFDFSFQPSISERQVRELAGGSYLKTATNVILLGPPGVGKTHLACALAVAAIESGRDARFTTLRSLVGDLVQIGNRDARTLRTYLEPALLVIDEIGYTKLSPDHARSLFDLVTARYERGSIIVTSNLTFTEWGALLGDDVLAAAMLDRLLHHAEVISINGRSYRMRHHAHTDQPISPKGGSE